MGVTAVFPQAGPHTWSRQVIMMSAFGFIVAMLVVTAGIAAQISRRTRREMDVMSENALESVELLGRIGVDLAQERRLVETHVMATTPAGMAPIEARIAAVRAEYQKTARAYAPLAIFAGESIAWRHLQDDVNTADLDVRRALALSHANRDDEARALLSQTSSLLDRIDRD